MSSITKNLGGDRLGSGNKMNVELHNYNRSTHDLSSIWRSTMAAGTLVPFMKKLALPGDNWEINLDAAVMTYPTVGPMFASFKLQLDIFLCPIRLYQGKLHNNALGIGMKMAEVKLPQIEITCNNLDFEEASKENGTPLEFQQIDQSSILAYLGIRGLGRGEWPNPPETIKRNFNAIPYLAYWDIFKNYYANKQEEIGAVIHSDITELKTISAASGVFNNNPTPIAIYPNIKEPANKIQILTIKGDNLSDEIIEILVDGTPSPLWYPVRNMFKIANKIDPNTIEYSSPIFSSGIAVSSVKIKDNANYGYNGVQVITFPLNKLDDMRNDLLLDAKKTTPYIINKETYQPYGLPLTTNTTGQISSRNPLEGLAVKTYQSDIFNNWLSTEWLENEQGTGINQITAVSTQGDNFQIDALILAKKVYDMLNRIAVSGGSYDDWLEAVWAHDSYRRAESPIYMGGLSREVIFQEVVSTSRSGEEPLGDLAGKGRLSEKKKGGYIEIKVDEPSYIIGIVSLTPRLDYSQGNEWDVNLQTMDDFHKPALDGIGFQELITDQMAFWDTITHNTTEFRSAGKQPAWINYMTDFNKSYGNFADSRKEMFMTLNRRYEFDKITGHIKDLTTYIDPAKFNYMFAYVDRSAQNFWVQIASDIKARRKMSAKIMPNL